MTLQPGSILASYRIVEKLGAGGMGVVWKAEDTRLGRFVAVKVLSAEMASDPDRIKRFEREARAVAALNHPNIVTLYSVEEDQGVRFIAMELVEGRTLAAAIPSGGMKLNAFFQLAVPLADALSAAHQSGIVHRDLKPSNIMINEAGRLKILDFGLAKLLESPESTDDTTMPTRSDTEAGRILGTMPYMSPEQLQGQAVDSRTDLFSAGIVLYQMATGRRPFEGGSSAVLISSILRDSPQSVSEVRVDLPNHLGRIVRHCLEKDPDRRYQTAKDLRNELADLHAEISSGELSTHLQVRRSRRWPIRTLAAVAILTLVAIGIGVGTRLGDRTSPKGGEPASAIAILPFVNLTGDRENEYLSQGISAALITQLGEVSGIRVVGRAAAWGERDPEASPQKRAERLGVGLLLEGELQRIPDRLRVDVKLTEADSALVLWSEGFAFDEENLFEVQQTIARELTTVLSIPLSPRELRRLARDPTASFQAYEFLLRGYQQIERDEIAWNLDGAVEMFRQAIRLDDRFALAHVGLSESLWLSYSADKDRQKLVEAEREAQRALEIDPELPAAQVALARVYRSTGRYEESIEELEKVLADHPKPDEAQRELAESHGRVGNLKAQERCLRAAAAMAGQHWFNWNALGAFLFESGRYDEAREAFEKSSSFAPPDLGIPHHNLAALMVQQGRFDEAIAVYDRIPRPIRHASLASNIGTAYYFSDRPDKWEQAEEYYRLAARLAPLDAVIRRNLADLCATLGRDDEAMHHYREALMLIEDPLESDPQNTALRLQQALYAAKATDCDKAVPLAVDLEETLPETASDMHKLAQVYAICGRVDAAVETIRVAIELGFPTEYVIQEEEFRPLHSNPGFIEVTSGGPSP